MCVCVCVWVGGGGGRGVGVCVCVFLSGSGFKNVQVNTGVLFISPKLAVPLALLVTANKALKRCTVHVM